jgi:hypothetical protein
VEPNTVPVHVPQLGDARGKHWAKVVTGVDAAKSTGWAFTGDFVADGGIQDLRPGAILLVYGERGGRTNPRPEAQVFTVNPDASLTPRAEARGRAWARTLRDTIAELLGGDGLPDWPGLADLTMFSEEELASELLRRGWTVTPPGSQS